MKLMDLSVNYIGGNITEIVEEIDELVDKYNI